MNTTRICLVALCLLCSGTIAADLPDANAAIQAASASEADSHFKQAAKQYGEAIDALTRARGQYNASLIEPLLGLGRSLARLNDYNGATDALRQAQYIMHRSEGVDSLRQLEIIDQLTRIHLDQGKPLDADREQRFSLYISEHNFPKDSPELVPALNKLGKWYMQTGQHMRARKVLENATKIIVDKFGNEDPRLIPELMLRARNTRLQRSCCSYRYLETARGIVKAHPDMSNDARAEVFISLGDAYLDSRKKKQAQAAYTRAWQLLGDDAARPKFAQPTLIATSRELDHRRQARTDIYVQRDIYGHMELKKLLDDEVLRLDSLPPQQFSVAPSQAAPGYFITDHYVPNETIGASQRVVGKPFRFLYKQLLQDLPLAKQNRAALSRLAMQLDFSVDSDGRAFDIVVTGAAVPPRLRRLMHHVLRSTTFRPRVVDGEPVATKHVRLVQTFD